MTTERAALIIVSSILAYILIAGAILVSPIVTALGKR